MPKLSSIKASFMDKIHDKGILNNLMDNGYDYSYTSLYNGLHANNLMFTDMSLKPL